MYPPLQKNYEFVPPEWSENETRSVMSDSLWPHGILQARTLEWVAFLFSRGSSWPRNQTRVSCNADGFFTNWAIREALIAKNQLSKDFFSLIKWTKHLLSEQDYDRETLREIRSSLCPQWAYCLVGEWEHALLTVIRGRFRAYCKWSYNAFTSRNRATNPARRLRPGRLGKQVTL